MYRQSFKLRSFERKAFNQGRHEAVNGIQPTYQIGFTEAEQRAYAAGRRFAKTINLAWAEKAA